LFRVRFAAGFVTRCKRGSWTPKSDLFGVHNVSVPGGASVFPQNVGVRLLQQADVLAKERDTLVWRLRIAINSAERHLARDQTTKARGVLAPAYESFKQGFNSKDLRSAAQILSAI
jgi:hypothetical protein